MGVNPAEWLKKRFASAFGVTVTKPLESDPRADGRDWPLFAHTMIGMERLSQLQSCVESVIQDNVPGDLIETGVWRGGTCILMRGVLKAYGDTDRRSGSPTHSRACRDLPIRSIVEANFSTACSMTRSSYWTGVYRRREL